MTEQKGSCGCGCFPVSRVEHNNSCACGCIPSEQKEAKAETADRLKKEEKEKSDKI